MVGWESQRFVCYERIVSDGGSNATLTSTVVDLVDELAQLRHLYLRREHALDLLAKALGLNWPI